MFCKQCGKEIEQSVRFCPHCGADQSSYVPSAIQAGLETKNTGLTAVLALILGFFGLWGVGHIYVGKIGRGIVLLILGIIIEWVGFGFLLVFGILSAVGHWYQMYHGTGMIDLLTPGLLVGWVIITLAVFIWQIYDAYNLAKYYNEYMQRYKKAPW